MPSLNAVAKSWRPRPRNRRMESGDRSTTKRFARPSQSMFCSRTACERGKTLTQNHERSWRSRPPGQSGSVP